ncbi:MAG: site-specific DNA-methyltransferase [Methylococcales symbiont of Iophon sp. n. MRB-2018]|nr:MAG: site-specific DNA-methyltransferase [Methylococcales symbiont of Iophon sp. n. MRB-2018]KAF3980236.1 MAG: site-specific DNA-methyltransferase [Methylococcales symbiont of Iophon sp. n. MRB-2018]
MLTNLVKQKDIFYQQVQTEILTAKINKIYNLDVFDFLHTKVADNSIDLAVIDPPYNMKKADWDSFKTHDDFLNFTFSWIEALLPKLKQDSSLYIFNTPFNSAYILQFLVSQRLDFKNWIVWNKQDGISAPKNKFVNGSETILFFTKGKPVFNFDDVREPYKSTDRMKHATKKGIIKNGKRWFPNPNGRLCSEIWDFSSERHKNKVNGKVQKMQHLTPKPKDMIEKIIKASSNKNDLVLDCFMGSGTTAIVSKKMDRDFIGTELNKDYYDLCIEQLKKYDG